MPQEPSEAVFHALVKDEQDVAGLLAFGVYLRQRQAERHKRASFHGVALEAVDVAAFDEIAATPAQQELYLQRGNDLLETWSKTALSNEVAAYWEDLASEFNDHKHRLAEEYRRKLERLQPRFGRDILASMVGSIAFFVSIVLVYLLFWAVDLTSPRALGEFLLRSDPAVTSPAASP